MPKPEANPAVIGFGPAAVGVFSQILPITFLQSNVNTLVKMLAMACKLLST